MECGCTWKKGLKGEQEIELKVRDEVWEGRMRMLKVVEKVEMRW